MDWRRSWKTSRDSAALDAQLDRLTGVYNREALMAMLFRETDRVQRLNSSLCLVLFDIDDFGHWNSRLGANACDELLIQVTVRTSRLLRSYDLLGGGREWMSFSWCKYQSTQGAAGTGAYYVLLSLH